MTAQQFATTAASSNMFEVESSKLAQKQAQRADVKSFAEKMIQDHTKASKDLEAAAKKAGIQVPAGMEQQHQAMLQSLQGIQRPNFDTSYIQAQFQAHDEAVQLFSSYSQSGDNAELKRFASEKLPTLKQHHSAVEKLKQDGGAGGSTGAGGAASPKK
jgi:putative membrane protein